MPRAVPEWIGKTDDARAPTSVQLRVTDRQDGHCMECPTRTGLQCDHIEPLADGGQNRESNLQMLCTYHHKLKTGREAMERGKVRRVKAKHIGIKKPRSITGWRRFDGSPVRAGRER